MTTHSVYYCSNNFIFDFKFSFSEYEKLKEEKSKAKEEAKKEQIEKLKNDLGEGKDIPLFGSQKDKDSEEWEEGEEINIDLIDQEERTDTDSFQKFLHSQGLKQSQGNQKKP